MSLMDFFGKTGKNRNNKATPTRDNADRAVKLHAEERSSADSISPKTTQTKNKVSPLKGKSLAEMICYHHKLGESAEDIAQRFNTDAETVLDIVREAKAEQVYEQLANCMGPQN